LTANLRPESRNKIAESFIADQNVTRYQASREANKNATPLANVPVLFNFVLEDIFFLSLL
jgi:hypothetical protein